MRHSRWLAVRLSTCPRTSPDRADERARSDSRRAALNLSLARPRSPARASVCPVWCVLQRVCGPAAAREKSARRGWYAVDARNLPQLARKRADTLQSSKKTSKMQQIIAYRIRVTLKDTRSLVGNMLAYDKHMVRPAAPSFVSDAVQNLVLGDCDEYRTVKRKCVQLRSQDKLARRVLSSAHPFLMLAAAADAACAERSSRSPRTRSPRSR